MLYGKEPPGMGNQDRSKDYGLGRKVEKKRMVPKVGIVIDSNIFVHWLMSNYVLEYVVQTKKLSSEFREVYSERYKESVMFIDFILSTRFLRLNFMVIELSLSEIISGIREEARTVILFNTGVPLSRWLSRRETKDAKIPEELGKEIYERTLKGFDQLFQQGGIEIIPTVAPSESEDYFDVYSSLIFYNPELTTQDAILLTTSIFEKANYFVTLDGVLIGLNKPLKNEYDLSVIKPQKALNIIRSGSF